jgi:hypothetical protein
MHANNMQCFICVSNCLGGGSIVAYLLYCVLHVILLCGLRYRQKSVRNDRPPNLSPTITMTSSGMPPPTQAPPPAPDPDLYQCINAIIAESGGHTARGAANLTVAMVGLSAIVAAEQDR